MKFMTGNIWDAYNDADLFLFCSHGHVDGNGHLLMERHLALQVAERYPGIEQAMGKAISKLKHRRDEENPLLYRFNLMVSPRWPQAKIGIFQTRLSVHDYEPHPHITLQSGVDLSMWCSINKGKQVHMDMPLTLDPKTQILMYHTLKPLPNDVHLWTHREWWQLPHYETPEDESEAEQFRATMMEYTDGVHPDQFFYGMWGYVHQGSIDALNS